MVQTATQADDNFTFDIHTKFPKIAVEIYGSHQNLPNRSFSTIFYNPVQQCASYKPLFIATKTVPSTLYRGLRKRGWKATHHIIINLNNLTSQIKELKKYSTLVD